MFKKSVWILQELTEGRKGSRLFNLEETAVIVKNNGGLDQGGVVEGKEVERSWLFQDIFKR